MTLARQMTRMPRPHDLDRGQNAASFVDVSDPALRDLIVGAAGCSPYLSHLVQREAAWLPSALTDPEGAVRQCLEPRDIEAPALKSALRQSKRRIALLTALADLGGAWSLEQVTGALSDLADMACEAALKAAIAQQVKRGKLPDHDPGLFVLAMGKMGAGELNYSSDIDLICLFDETRHAPTDFPEIRRACINAVRNMCASLSDLTEDGYVFRTDLRLRPDPSVNPVVLSMGAAERYYESLGRTWERAAYIKARPCAGDIAAGERFIETLRPFVWRRHLDFAAVQDAHDMRLAIRAHKGTGGPITLPGHNMKLGRGGIREIEFFTQTRQLIAGGRDPSLRVRGTVDGLQKLAQADWIIPSLERRLADHYRFARTVEHRVQMVQDAQTHTLPNSDEGFDRLAAMMDMDRTALEATLKSRLSEVHGETEGFFAPKTVAQETTSLLDLDPGVQARWRSYPALRSQRGAALFVRIEPMLLARLAQASRPAEALSAFDGFLAGLPAGVQLFSLFDANPQLVDLLIDIVSVSPALAHYLSRNAGVLDAVLGGDFFADWPGYDWLKADAAQRLAGVEDYEAKLDAIRVWAREWHFRVGVHHLRNLSTAKEAGAQYADLARASLSALWPEVQAQFAKRHGAPPGRGAIIVAMGSLGAGQLTAQSDLDLIVIYDPEGVEHSDGRRTLASRIYYARLTQAMITAVTAQTAQRRLYEADMRLRPSGNKGPVATSWAAFQSYQMTEAWLWEHMALTRAAAIAGPEALGADFEAFRRTVIAQPREAGNAAQELSEMRARVAAAKTPNGVWDAKIGAGRLQDIELLSQVGTLLAGVSAYDVASGLSGGVATGLLDVAGAHVLGESYDMLWRVQMAARLLSTGGVSFDDVGAGGQAILMRAIYCDTQSESEAALVAAHVAAEQIIANALAPKE